MLPITTSHNLVANYTTFTKRIMWFKTLCAGSFSNNIDDYIKGHDSLINAYEALRKSTIQKSTSWDDLAVRGLLKSIGIILYSAKVSVTDLRNIAKMLAHFEENEEAQFMKRWLDACVPTSAKTINRLFQMVESLFASQQYDTAVITAFKYLEGHLQKKLNVSPHEFYGEKLMNYAFAPQSGKLQLGTNESEQQGLRNFFSGAYALFRNPSAHRFVEYSGFTASVIVAMVAMMVEMSTSAKKYKARKKPVAG